MSIEGVVLPYIALELDICYVHVKHQSTTAVLWYAVRNTTFVSVSLQLLFYAIIFLVNICP
jgi:hypothetical protein